MRYVLAALVTFGMVCAGCISRESSPSPSAETTRVIKTPRGYTVRIDRSQQILRVYIDDPFVERVAQPTLAEIAQGDFTSAGVLIHKAKQFDDGLYAAVERAMQEGVGPVEGKRQWLARLAANVDAKQGGVPLAQLLAAIELGGGTAPARPNLEPVIAREREQFLAMDARSKPIGFYTWSEELEGIFRQNRMLQSPLAAREHSAGLEAVAKALASDAELRKSYDRALHLYGRLSNPQKEASFSKFVSAATQGRRLSVSGSQPVYFFPPSRSPEDALLQQLGDEGRDLEGFDLMQEVVDRLRSGKLSLQPKADSGWYDRVLWSLEPLVRLDAAREGQRLRCDESYRSHLEQLFKGAYATARETNSFSLPGATQPQRERVFIDPEPRVELLPTMYLRRAQAYRYIRQELEGVFGIEHLAKLRRLTADGPVETSLADELAWMERLCLGAYVVACRDLGMNQDSDAKSLGDADESAQQLINWTASLSSDPDVGRDSRMMVPVFYDSNRQKTKAWVMLGWHATRAYYQYSTKPTAAVTDPEGNSVTGDKGPELIYGESPVWLATPVFAEVYVAKLLNRDEFRKHCDTYVTKSAILSHLE